MERIAAIMVSVDENWGIGRNGELLKRIPADMKRFKEMTMGNIIITGRKTFESFPGGKALPGRINIVVTRNEEYAADAAIIVKSPEEAVRLCEGDPGKKTFTAGGGKVFVVGGGEIYRSLIDYCDRAYVTKIRASFDADTFFPDLDKCGGWKLINESGEQEECGVSFTYCEYARI